MNAQHVFSTQGFSHVVIDGQLVPLENWHPSDRIEITGYGTAKDNGCVVEAVSGPINTSSEN